MATERLNSSISAGRIKEDKWTKKREIEKSAWKGKNGDERGQRAEV